MSEADFHHLVRSWLADNFVRVEHQPTLDDTRHSPDFAAETPFDSYVIEVEDDWDSVYTGVGQAFIYATETTDEAVLVLPADAVDPDDVEYVTGIKNLEVVFL